MATTSTRLFSFTDGQLHILTEGVQLRLRWSPKPRAEEKSAQGEWVETYPGYRLLRPITAEKDHPYAPILKAMPGIEPLAAMKQAAFDGFRQS